jgi:hypothetical protein
MGNKKFNTFLAILILVLVVWMVKGTFMQPGVNDLKGGFKEIAHYRNENNTGPIQHVFAVTIKDTSAAELETYGNFMPHHKGGNTKVYFFLEGFPVPENLYAGKINFDPKFNQYCIALYEKTAMGNTSITQMQKNQ